MYIGVTSKSSYMSVKTEIVFLYLFFTTKLFRFVIAKLTPRPPVVTSPLAERYFQKISVILQAANVTQNRKNRMIRVASACRLTGKSGITLSAGFTKHAITMVYKYTRIQIVHPFARFRLVGRGLFESVVC